ncbi:MAG: response regulator [Nitrospirae bacterium]|nr:response regulator [Nitrospirota bacterium]
MSETNSPLKEKLKELKNNYVRQLPGRLQQIKEMWHRAKARKEALETIEAHEALVEAHRMVHNLYGSCTTFGLSTLTVYSKELEVTLKNLLEDGATLSEEIEDSIKKTLSIIESQIEKLPDGSADAKTTGGQLPERAADADTTEGQLPDRSATCDYESGLVLIFYKNPDSLHVIRAMLEEACFSVISINSVEELGGALGHYKPIAAIVDVTENELDKTGVQRFKEIHQKIAPSVPFIFISDKTDFQNRLATASACGIAHFTEPVEPTAIIEKIKGLTVKHTREPYRILILDDEPDIANFYSLVLQNEGMMTMPINDPGKILAVLGEFYPDLILMDMYMPGCTGMDVARVVRQIEEYVSIPIVFLSSESDVDKQLRAMSVGGDDFLNKSIQVEHLISSVTIRAERMRIIRSLNKLEDYSQTLEKEVLKRTSELKTTYEVLKDKSNQLEVLNKHLENRVQAEIKQHREKNQLLQIGIALSSEECLDNLLEMIVVEAMNFTSADGGTLYIKNDDDTAIVFKILRNTSMNFQMGGGGCSSGVNKVTFPPLKLYNADGEKNTHQVAVYVALSGETVNIPDVYDVEGFDFKGTKAFDKNTGYRSKSMLVTALRNHENEIIGVLQLINSQDEGGNVIPFSGEYQDVVESLASQAAIAITNTTLISDLKNLLDAFIKVIATAIDEKSPYTGGHIRRVAELTLEIARGLSNSAEERWQDFDLPPDEENELKIAGWMHDIGKITTPEYVVDKATKLETIYDRIHTVEAKFEILKRDIENEYLRKKIEILSTHGSISQEALDDIDASRAARIKKADQDLDFIRIANIGGEFMADDKIKQLKEISSITIDINGVITPVLTGNEVYNLSIKRGTLNEEERIIIQNHVVLSRKMLARLPWPKKLRHVCEIASEHHEKLNGSGYPSGLTAEEISTKSRILAIADIFDALSAIDRPYKKGKTLSECIKIIEGMAKGGHIDKEIMDFFITSGILANYAVKELKEYQLDQFTYNGVEFNWNSSKNKDSKETLSP